MQAQIEGDYDPETGFTVKFDHVEDSGYYDCQVQGNDDYSPLQLHILIQENSEWNISSSFSTDSLLSINPTIDDVNATIISSSVELHERLELFLSSPGDGLKFNSKGVCCN